MSNGTHQAERLNRMIYYVVVQLTLIQTKLVFILNACFYPSTHLSRAFSIETYVLLKEKELNLNPD